MFGSRIVEIHYGNDVDAGSNITASVTRMTNAVRIAPATMRKDSGLWCSFRWVGNKCVDSRASSFGSVDSDMPSGAQKIAAGGSNGKRRLASRYVAKEQDCKNDDHRPHGVEPVLLELWMPPIRHGNGLDGLTCGRLSLGGYQVRAGKKASRHAQRRTAREHPFGDPPVGELAS